MYVSAKRYDKVSIKWYTKAIDINVNFTDDIINNDDEFIKNEYYIKIDQIKNACIADIFEKYE